MKDDPLELELNSEANAPDTHKGSQTVAQTVGGCMSVIGLMLAGMLIWVFLYLLVMNHYEYRTPGGHHFGGGDLAPIEACFMGFVAGPFVGLSLVVLRFKRLRWGRFPLVVILMIFPTYSAHKNFSKYRDKHAEVMERKQTQQYVPVNPLGAPESKN